MVLLPVLVLSVAPVLSLKSEQFGQFWAVRPSYSMNETFTKNVSNVSPLAVTALMVGSSTKPRLLSSLGLDKVPALTADLDDSVAMRSVAPGRRAGAFRSSGFAVISGRRKA
jgi:hypothetical protein